MKVTSICKLTAALLLIFGTTIALGQTTSNKKNLTQKKIAKKKVQKVAPAEEIEEDEITLLENEGLEGNDTVFEIFDVTEIAIFQGGNEGLQQFIAENIKYPAKAIENDITGIVQVMFIVTSEGKVKNIQIVGKRKGYGLEEEAMRVIRLTSGMWKPAMQRDKPVDMRFRVPIAFYLY